MAEIFTIDADGMPIYVEYFDITLIPATVFFYNGQHIKVDYGYEYSFFQLIFFWEKGIFILVIVFPSGNFAALSSRHPSSRT